MNRLMTIAVTTVMVLLVSACAAPVKGGKRFVKRPERVVGTVEDLPVTVSEVLAKLEQTGRKDVVLAGDDDQARRAVASSLGALVIEKLLRREALSGLDETELEAALESARVRMIKTYGQGDPNRAERMLWQYEGMGLEEKATEDRDQWVVNQFLADEVVTRVPIGDADIRRTYERDRPRYGKDFEAVKERVASDLRESRYAWVLGRMRRDLLGRGRYTPIEEMTGRVMRELRTQRAASAAP